MQGRRHEIARLQSDFFRDQFRKILRWLATSFVLMWLMLLVAFYLILFEPPIRFYANTSDGKILNMPAPKQTG